MGKLIDPNTGKLVKRSTGWAGINSIYRSADKLGTPYMTRAWIGRLRLHIFHRGDGDPDPHDHPWPFWTFPLTSYVEEVTTRDWVDVGIPSYRMESRIVRAFRLNYRPANHTHRVIGRYSGLIVDDFGFTHSVSANRASELPADRFTPQTDRRKIITIVWRGKEERKWGFLKYRDGRWCWQHWKEYIVNGGKDGPCQ